jgi:hypothetical protein
MITTHNRRYTLVSSADSPVYVDDLAIPAGQVVTVYVERLKSWPSGNESTRSGKVEINGEIREARFVRQ